MAGAVTDIRSHMLRADTLALVFAAGVANVLSAMRAQTHALPGAHFARLAAGGDAAGGVVIGIRTPDIPGSAITARVTVIHITDLTVTPPVGTTIHITGIILTGTDTGPTGA
jgi:hypothetical protein